MTYETLLEELERTADANWAPEPQKASRAAASSLTALLVLAGCGAGDQPKPATHGEFLQRDSAGIVIAESDGATARAASGWTIEPEPDLQIGTLDGPDEYMLHWIAGVVQMPGGHVVLVNGGSHELRFYDQHGAFLHKTGRRGRGPGEYERPWLVPSHSRDSLIVIDRPLRRITVYDKSGELRRTYTGDHRTLRASVVGSAGGTILFSHTVHMMGVLGPFANPTDFLLYQPVESTTDTVAALQGREFFGVPVDSEARVSEISVPFSIAPGAATGRDGYFINPVEGPEIRELDAEGHLRRVIRLAEAPRLATPADIDAYVAAQVAAAPSDANAAFLRRVYGSGSIPVSELIPTFDSLLVDDLGWLWARTYDFDPEAPRVWLVFDPEGRAHGSVEVPPGLDVQQVGEDFVLGTWRDEFGVEYVRRHQLARTP